MAWCVRCQLDRPITRQPLAGPCPVCGGVAPGRRDDPHAPWCRGPAAGELDVCAHCNDALFAKALTAEQYEALAAAEAAGLELGLRAAAAERRPATLRAFATSLAVGLLCAGLGLLPYGLLLALARSARESSPRTNDAAFYMVLATGAKFCVAPLGVVVGLLVILVAVVRFAAATQRDRAPIGHTVRP